MAISPDSMLSGMGTGGAIKHYSLEEKECAVAMYAVLGNMEEVSRQTGISPAALSSWKKEEWFHRSLSDVRSELAHDLDGKFTNLIDEAIETVKESLVYGDEKTTSRGVRYRQKMSGKDAAVVLSVVYDKRQIGRSLPTSISGSQSGGLEAMMQEFKKVAAQLDAKTIDSEGRPIQPED